MNYPFSKRLLLSINAALLLCFGLLFTQGCTRPADSNKPAKLSIALPAVGQGKVGSLSLNPAHIVINISGPGIPNTIVFNWDSNCQCPANIQNPPPPSIDLDVPAGGSRLIQVILVLQDNATKAMSFKYGDVVQDLVGGSNTVSITTAPFGTSSGQQGNFTGRYIGSNGLKPTGNLIMKIQPPNPSRPAMRIQTVGMYAGWFNTFVIDGAPFIYDMESDGTRILSGFMFSSPDLAASPQMVHGTIPSYYRSDSYGGPPTYSFQGSQDFFAGFVGPGAAAAGNVACYDPSTGININGAYTTSSGGPQLTWDGVSTTTTTAAHRIAGGQTTGLCANTSNEFMDHVLVKSAYITNDKNFLGFDGPFKLTYSGTYGSAFMTSFVAGQGVNVSWTFLPGVLTEPGHIDGVDVLARPATPTSGGYYGGHDNMTCYDFLPMGYNVVSTTTGQTATIPSSSSTQGFDIAVCPFMTVFGLKNYVGRPYTTSFYSGAGVGLPPGTKLSLQGSPTIHTTACNQVTLSVLDNTGSRAGAPGPVSVNLNSSPAGGYFYNDFQCSQMLTTPIILSPGQSGYVLYYQVTSGTSFNLNAMDGNSPLTDSPALAMTVGTTPTLAKFGILGNSNVTTGACIQYLVQAQDSSGLAMATGGGITATLSDGAAGGAFYSDSGCTSVASTATFTTNQTYAPFFYKVPGGTNATLTATYSSNTGSTCLSITLPGPLHHFAIMGNMTQNVSSSSTCPAITVQAQDMYGNPTSVGGTPVSVTLTSSTVGTFYSTGPTGCAGGVSSTTISIPAGLTSTTTYYSNVKAGPDSITLTSPAASTNTSTIGLIPGPAMYALVILPGQSINEGTTTLASAILGSPGLIMTGTTYPLTVFATDSYFNIVRNYNNAYTVSAVTAPSSLTPGSPSFTNGVGNFSVSWTGANAGNHLGITATGLSTSPSPWTTGQNSANFNVDSPASLTFSPTTITFTSTPYATTANLTVTITNAGTTPANNVSWGITGTNAANFARTGGTCSAGGTIPASGSCTSIISFTPPTAGSYNAIFNMGYTPVMGSPLNATAAINGSGI